MDLLLTALGGLLLLFDSKRKKKTDKNKNGEEVIKMKKIEGKVTKALKNKISENINLGLYIESLGRLTSNTFTVAPDGTGLQVRQLGKFVLRWEHFDAIVKKANELGGKMYRGDVIARSGGKLGEEISYDCMEGFIAGELLHSEEGKAVTRRSTYYSGILAWAGIVMLNNSNSKGSYITINAAFRDI